MFTLEGVHEDRGFFMHHHCNGHEIRGFEVTYPESERDQVRPIALAMSERFIPFAPAPLLRSHAPGVVAIDPNLPCTRASRRPPQHLHSMIARLP